MSRATNMTTIKFCECGRTWPCKHKDHEEFNSATYAKKHFKKIIRRSGGGYSVLRDEQGEFQPGVDKKNFR